MKTRPKIVILAEDEGLIRMMMADELGDRGFEVLQAANAEEAIELLGIHGAAVQALFTDIHMPGSVDGLGLAKHTHQHFPKVALVLASGHSNPSPQELPPGSRFFPKPYDIDKVIQHLQSVTVAD